MLAPAFNNHQREVPVFKTVASQKQGIAELYAAINILLQEENDDTKKPGC
ncbi:hypothetical protein [Paraflavitalea speifideaquila]|nr:hypothetical protein [Paraflavitalea speifideiaquila]